MRLMADSVFPTRIASRSLPPASGEQGAALAGASLLWGAYRHMACVAIGVGGCGCSGPGQKRLAAGEGRPHPLRIVGLPGRGWRGPYPRRCAWPSVRGSHRPYVADGGRAAAALWPVPAPLSSAAGIIVAARRTSTTKGQGMADTHVRTESTGVATDEEGRPYANGFRPATLDWDGWTCADCTACGAGAACADCQECTAFAAPYPPHWAKEWQEGQPDRSVEGRARPGRRQR